MLCPRFFGGSSQRDLTFSWSQSQSWVYSSPLTTQAIWSQNLAGCCIAFELSSSLLTWSQTPYFILSTPSSATRTDATASTYPQVATSIDLKHLLTWSQLQVNPVVRNSAGGPNHVVSLTKQDPQFSSWASEDNIETWGNQGLHLLW